MNTEVVETVLNEVLYEQKEAVKLNMQLIGRITDLASKMEGLEKKINNLQETASIEELNCLKNIMQDIDNIKQLVAVQQKDGRHEKRIMIFPEFKSVECYRLLFNCIVYITIATYSFLIIKVMVSYWCK